MCHITKNNIIPDEDNTLLIYCKIKAAFTKVENRILALEAKFDMRMLSMEHRLESKFERRIAALESKMENMMVSLENKIEASLNKPENNVVKPACPICFERMSHTTKIAQCIFGHHVCWNCKEKLEKNECPMCGYPVDGRAFGMECYLKTIFG